MKKSKNLLFMMVVLSVFFMSATHLLAQDPVQELRHEVELLKERVKTLEQMLEQSRGDPFHRKQSRRQQPHSSPPARLFNRDDFDDMFHMQEMMEQLMEDAFNRRHMSGPRQRFHQKGLFDQAQFEIEESLNAYEIKIDLSGIDKDNMKIDINAHSVTITREYVRQNQQSWGSGMMRSSQSGRFMQTIPLPVDADTDNIEQQEQGDLLIITVPKKSKI